jgi:hypothetical protein
MHHKSTTRAGQIDKKHVATVILFAIKHVPNTDEATLNKFLEMVNLTGSFGWITDEQLLAEMKLMMKYVPGSCADSLLTVIELLNVCVPLNIGSSNLALLAPKINQS